MRISAKETQRLYDLLLATASGQSVSEEDMEWALARLKPRKRGRPEGRSLHRGCHALILSNRREGTKQEVFEELATEYSVEPETISKDMQRYNGWLESLLPKIRERIYPEASKKAISAHKKWTREMSEKIKEILEGRN